MKKLVKISPFIMYFEIIEIRECVTLRQNDQAKLWRMWNILVPINLDFTFCYRQIFHKMMNTFQWSLFLIFTYPISRCKVLHEKGICTSRSPLISELDWQTLRWARYTGACSSCRCRTSLSASLLRPHVGAPAFWSLFRFAFLAKHSYMIDTLPI